MYPKNALLEVATPVSSIKHSMVKMTATTGMSVMLIMPMIGTAVMTRMTNPDRGVKRA